MTGDVAHETLVLAVRAETKADGAHERLDRMNGSIDRLTHEVAGANEAIANAKGELSAKLDGVLLQLAHQTGMAEGGDTVKKLMIDSRRFVITTFVALTVGIAGLAGTLAYVLMNG